jgi:PDGLE domain
VAAKRTQWAFIIGGLVVALALAGIVSSFASSSPDGLNKVAGDQGFADTEQDHPLGDSPLEGYGVQGVENDRLSTGLAGVIGVVLTFLVGLGLFALVRRRRRTEASRASPR